MYLENGDIVFYQYTHHLNRKSSTEIIKKGVFIRWVFSKKGHYCKRRTDMAVVQIDGNKHPSKIHISQLTKKQP